MDAGIVMQVVTGAVKVAVVVIFNSGQAVQCRYGGGKVCCGASTTVVDPAPSYRGVVDTSLLQ